MKRNRVLVVDDDPGVRMGLRRFLEAKGYEICEADGVRAAESACGTTTCDVAVVDQRLPDGDGIELVRRLKEARPGMAVIVLTGHGSIELAVRAIKEGAEQFLTKPLDLQAVLVVIERAIEDGRARSRQAAREAQEGRGGVDPFAGESAAIRALAADARRLLESDSPILITGETGTGKGVLARWLHENGPRRREPFVDLNCAMLSRELLESELFGHEVGAFTGATRRKEGLLEVAHHGTVFLDEIGDMDAAIQARVLKVVEEKRFRRLGDVRDHAVDVRLVAATHRDLERAIREGAFREDLYYRISALPLHIPPLRERRPDVPVLARTIVAASARARGPVPTLAPEALEALQSYDWPGNIRELRNVIERALLVAAEPVLRPADFRFAAPSAASSAAPSAATTLAEVERLHIERVLEQEGGHVARAARRLGISTSSLYERLKRFAVPAGRG